MEKKRKKGVYRFRPTYLFLKNTPSRLFRPFVSFRFVCPPVSSVSFARSFVRRTRAATRRDAFSTSSRLSYSVRHLPYPRLVSRRVRLNEQARFKKGRKGWRRRKRVTSEKGRGSFALSREDDNATTTTTTTTTTRGNSFDGTEDDEHQSPILAREKAPPHSSTGWCCVFDDAPRSPAVERCGTRFDERSFACERLHRRCKIDGSARYHVYVQTVRLCKTLPWIYS